MADGKSELKDRIHKRIRLYAAVLLLGSVYCVWVRFTGLGIPCPIRMITGWKCPGCGITTLFVRLFKLDIHGAFEANSFLFLTLPFLAAELVFSEACYFRGDLIGKKARTVNTVATCIYLVCLIAFGISRNIFPFLS